MKFYSIFSTQEAQTNATTADTENDDDATVVTGENRGSNGRETREIRLKWVYPMASDKRKVLQSHHSILGMMMKAHPDLVVIDNKAREHTDKKTMKSTEKNRPFEFFSDNRYRHNRQLVCIHRIRTTKPLAELKESWGVIEELQKQRAYVRTHAFGEKDREISHIGFIPGVHMVHIPKSYVKNEIMNMLKQDHGDVPNFEIVQVGVDMGKGCKVSERTRAYEIQCVQKDASSLAKRLQSGQFKTNPVYVPYRIKKSDPNTFKRAISRQNKILSEQWVIKAQGLTQEMIEQINEKLLSHVEAVVPTANKEKGEWKFLVNRTKYTQSINKLQESWEDILNSIPTVMKDESPFDAPAITSRKSIANENSSDEGTVDTYGTILSSLYYGEQGDEEEVHSEVSDSEDAPTDHSKARPVSYAQVLGGTTSTVSQVSGFTEHRNEEFAKLQERHLDLEEKFNTVTAELGALRDLLQQLISQGKTSATEHDLPNKRQATFETPQRLDRRQQRHEDNMETDNESNDDSDAGQFQLRQK